MNVFVMLAIILFVAVPISSAAPNNENKAENNHNVVAYYPLSLHAIPTYPITYVVGTNMVIRRGNSNQIEAWYSSEVNHGYHSVWNLSKDGKCSQGWVYIENAYPSWGDYLAPDADYCVKVNQF